MSGAEGFQSQCLGLYPTVSPWLHDLFIPFKLLCALFLNILGSCLVLDKLHGSSVNVLPSSMQVGITVQTKAKCLASLLLLAVRAGGQHRLHSRAHQLLCPHCQAQGEAGNLDLFCVSACSHHGRFSLIDSCTRGHASIHFSACIAKDRVWRSPWAVHSKASLRSLQRVGQAAAAKAVPGRLGTGMGPPCQGRHAEAAMSLRKLRSDNVTTTCHAHQL